MQALQPYYQLKTVYFLINQHLANQVNQARTKTRNLSYLDLIIFEIHADYLLIASLVSKIDFITNFIL